MIANRPSFSAFRAAARRVPAVPYSVDRPIDERGQYQRELPVEFPFEINRLVFRAGSERPLTWHSYLEIFVPLSSTCRRRADGEIDDLGCGDVLVMDNLKLHAIDDFPEPQAEALVIRFAPNVVRSAALTASEQLLLLPFYCHVAGQPHVLRASESAAREVHVALKTLIECYLSADHSPYWQMGSRAAFLTVLHHLARRFRAAEQLQTLFSRQQIKTGRLQKVFTYIDEHFADTISSPRMAATAGLSPQRFYTLFKAAAGMTLSEYVIRTRLRHAVRLLQETNCSMAEIANAVGFADQSYFDRRFRRHFGTTPFQFRRKAIVPLPGLGADSYAIQQAG